MGNSNQLSDSMCPKLAYSIDWVQIASNNNEIYGEVKVYRNSRTHEECALKSILFQERSRYLATLKQIHG